MYLFLSICSLFSLFLFFGGVKKFAIKGSKHSATLAEQNNSFCKNTNPFYPFILSILNPLRAIIHFGLGLSCLMSSLFYHRSRLFCDRITLSCRRSRLFYDRIILSCHRSS